MPRITLTTLGRSSLAVSRLGLGLAALGRPGYMTLGHGQDLGDTAVAAMQRRCHAVLDAAFAGGVRFVDAARSYGRAEEFLASWLAARDRPPATSGAGDDEGATGAVTVGSKWGYTYTAGWRAVADTHEVKDHALATFTRQLDESRALLGGHLHLYQIHSVTPDSPVLGDAAVLDALARLRDGGVLVGLTLSGPRQAEVLERARAVRRGGEPLFGCVEATYNVLERSCERALAEAHAAGMGVIVKEALANGRLARGVPALDEAARALSTTADAVALAAVLARPWADVVLSGAVTVEQLEQNLGAATLALDGETVRALDALVEDPLGYWTARSKLPWT